MLGRRGDPGLAGISNSRKKRDTIRDGRPQLARFPEPLQHIGHRGDIAVERSNHSHVDLQVLQVVVQIVTEPEGDWHQGGAFGAGGVKSSASMRIFSFGR